MMVGCATRSDYPYGGFRRSTDRFQTADRPVYTYKVDPDVGGDDLPIAALNKFELPDSDVILEDRSYTTPAPMPVPMPRPIGKAIPNTMRNAQPLDSHTVPQTSLPQSFSASELSKKDVQYLLKKLDFYQGKIDGVHGPQTIAAIKKFQKSEKLTVDGVVGKKTRLALVKRFQASVVK